MDVQDFVAILKDHGVRRGSGVPCSYFTPVVDTMGWEPGLDYLPAASEGEAVAIAAGMVTAGRPAFALMQNSGLGNAVNPITSMLVIYGMPVVLMISHRGEPGRPDEPQHQRMGVITYDLARLCGLECRRFEPASFAAEIGDARDRGVPAAWVFRKGALSGAGAPDRRAPAAGGARVALRAVAETPARCLAPELTREEALAAALPLLAAAAVVSTTGKLSREVYELGDRENRFYMVGSMGCAAGFGLGVARAWSGRVAVLDGDGALLMKLGTAATVGALGPANFHHLVFDNGAYDSTGGQPTVSPAVDLAALAGACGYRRADTVAAAGELGSVLAEHLESGGPTLLRILVRPGARPDLGRPSIAPRDVYLRFRAWLEEHRAP